MSWCDACQNMGVVNCYCGGDLCVCTNYGEMICPECDGDIFDDIEDHEPDDCRQCGATWREVADCALGGCPMRAKPVDTKFPDQSMRMEEEK